MNTYPRLAMCAIAIVGLATIWSGAVATESVHYFTTEGMAAAVQQLADFRASQGYSAEVIVIDGFPTDPTLFRAALRAAINARAASGSNFFVLVGDANDWYQFFGPDYPALWTDGAATTRTNWINYSGYIDQSAHDIIPTYYVADTTAWPHNMAQPYTYFNTDQPYADTDDDDSPNVVVARLPFISSSEVVAYYNKLVSHESGALLPPCVVASYVNTFSNGTIPGAGSAAMAAYESVRAALPAGDVEYQYIVTSSAPENEAAASLWNDRLPEFVLFMGSASTRRAPAMFMNFLDGFDMSMLQVFSNHTPVVLAPVCSAANFAMTEGSSGAPACERFLKAELKGAIAWIGPSCGTWQEGDKVVARYCIEEMLGNRARPIGESWRIALARVLRDFTGAPEMLKTARSYAFLGDPLCTVRSVSMPTNAGGKEQLPGRPTLGVTGPNPFNPSTVIRFAVPDGMHTVLQVVDVRGRAIRSLCDGVARGGWQTVRWDGCDQRGHSMASGVYIVRLDAGGYTLTSKVTLAK